MPLVASLHLKRNGLMAETGSNPCIRCGRERIVVRTYVEQTGAFPVTHTITSCPDKACQAAVEKKFKEERERREALQNRRD